MSGDAVEQRVVEISRLNGCENFIWPRDRSLYSIRSEPVNKCKNKEDLLEFKALTSARARDF